MRFTSHRCLALLVALCVASCGREPSFREQLAEARVLESEGRFEEARALYVQVVEGAPSDAEVHLRFASFLLGREELHSAGEVLLGASGVEMTASQRERYDTTLDTYWRAVLSESRGGGEVPSDRRRYEDALLGLIQIHEGGDALEEYHAWLLSRARRALGRPAASPIEAGDLSEAVERATPGQAAEALEALGRLLEGDPTWASPYPIPDDVVEEGTRIRSALERRLFRDRFVRAWTRRHEARLTEEGRFDASSEELVLTSRGPAPHPVGEDDPETRQAFVAQTYGTRELLTDLAYELAGLERAGAEALPFAIGEFASVRVEEARIEEGSFTMRVRAPFALLERAGFLLERRQQSS